MTDYKDYTREIHDMYWVIYRNRIASGMEHKQAKKCAYDAIEDCFRIGEQSIRKIINKVYSERYGIASCIINNGNIIKGLQEVIDYERKIMSVLEWYIKHQDNADTTEEQNYYKQLSESVERHEEKLNIMQEIYDYYAGTIKTNNRRE